MFYIPRLTALFLFVFLALALELPRVEAGVAVVSNSAAAPIHFYIIGADGKQQPYSLERTDLVPIQVADKIDILFESEGKPIRYSLEANTINQFVSIDKGLELRMFTLPAPPDEDKNLPRPKARNVARSTYTFSVKILVDDDQPAVRKIWEKELRERVAAASEIFEHHCGVRFEVKAVDTWVSDNQITEFHKSLAEFESKVDPSPEQLAIGFTSQYAIPRGMTHLGATRGPLHPYIMIREWSQYVTKSERLEILVHEMGHFLGASHTANPGSVMRPQLGDRRSHLTSFRIGFDPLNTLAMNLLSDELRSQTYHGFWRMPLDTRRELQRIYLMLGKELPKDPAAAQYIEMLHLPAAVTVSTNKPDKPQRLVAATQAVVRAVVTAAITNNTASMELKGDGLTEYFIGRAAAEALNQPPDVARKAFLLGIGIALDDSGLLCEIPVLGDFCKEVETDDGRENRVLMLGKPTILGREDLTKHFAVSCALTVQLGPQAAEQAGIIKEISDAQGKSGFSFADLTADMAGIAFTLKIRDGALPLAKLTDSFLVRDFVPEIKNLKEGIPWKEFTDVYGSQSDNRFQNVRNEILKRIQELPGYKQ